MHDFLPTYDQIIQYVYQQFSLSYDAPELPLEQLKACCINNDHELALLLSPINCKPTNYFDYKEYRVPVFFKETIKNEIIKDGKVFFDVYLNSFLLLSGIQEWLCDQKDAEGRFPFSHSLQCKYNFVAVPAVNVYFDLLAKALVQKGHCCTAKNHKEPIVFTHDIDQIRSGWLEDILSLLSPFKLSNTKRILQSLLVKLLKHEDSHFSGLLKMIKIDKENQLKSISFLMTKKSHRDADYELSMLEKNGLFNQQRIGLHPGYDTDSDQQELEQQLKTLQTRFPKTELILRQHFLKYDVKKTPEIHESLGIKEDYTLGFAEQYGFRNSIASPFHLYDFNKKRAFTVLQYPLYFMDGTLIKYLKKNDWEAKQVVIVEVKKLLRNFNCSFSVLFHNTAFTQLKKGGFDRMYQEIIQLYKDKKTRTLGE